MNTQERLDYLLEGIVTLPSQPHTLTRITDLMNDPECSLQAVGRVISSDPSIALKALRLVNSAHYGIRNKVVSVEHAVMLLGLKVIRNLVLTATVFETFDKNSMNLLRHSLGCGVAMRTIAATLPSLATHAEDGFVYGLLHDIGKIIFQQYLQKENRSAEAMALGERIPLYRAEREVIGVDHAAMGARLARNWGLPDALVSALEAHHDLDACENPLFRPNAAALGIANYITRQTGMDSLAGSSMGVDDRCWTALGVTGVEMAAILDAFFAGLPEVEELAGIAL